MDNKFILNEIKKWEKERIISSEQAVILRKRYPETGKKNAAALVFSLVGIIFTAAGAAAILAWWHIELSQGVRAVLSFLPLCVSFLAALLTLIMRKDSVNIRESVAVFYTAAIFITYKLTEYVFNVPTDYARYIICCGFMILPVALIFRSVFSVGAFIYTVISWGYLMSDSTMGTVKSAFAFSLTLALTAAGIAFLLKITKNEAGILRVLAVWFSAAAVFAVILIFGILTKSNTAAVLLLLFASLYAAGKKNDKIYSPFTGAGTAGSFVMLALFSYGVFSPPEKGFSLINFLLPVFLTAFLFLSLVLSREYGTKKCILSASAVVCAGLITLLDSFLYSKEYPLWASAVCALCLLAASIAFIADGAKYSKLSDVNLGLISVFAVVFSFFAHGSNGAVRGVFLLFLGIIFLAINIILSRKFAKNTVGGTSAGETEAAGNEEQ